ncbi:hypothetical protein Tco_0950799 [Tanacetum coccineum]
MFIAPPPMIIALEARNKNKYCEFHRDKGHNTNDCLHLRRKIEEVVKSDQLAHLVKGIKQSNKASTSKVVKKPDQTHKDKGVGIFMVYFWGKNVRPQTGLDPLPQMDISFTPLIDANLEDYLIVICAEIGGHDVHKMHMDGDNSLDILYEHWQTGDTRSRSSLVYHPWDDEIYNEGGSSHYSERKSQTTANSDGASANHSSPKDRRCQGSNAPRYPEKAIMLGGRLAKEGKRAMCEVLKSNLDVFAYKPEDMNGVPRTLSEHKLGVKEGTPSLLDKRKEDKN